MQEVSNKFLSALRANNKSLEIVVEFYHYDALPGANGFDPAQSDFLFGASSVGSVNFRTRAYQRLIAKNGIGQINRLISKQISNFTLTLSNATRTIIDFENAVGFEGLICVVRCLDRATSTELNDSIILFTGRCEPPDEFSRQSETARIVVKQILNQTETLAPRRKFTTTDAQGRAQSDPEFEGFIYSARGGYFNYQEKVASTSFFGRLFGKTKNVTRTQSYSSHSDLKEETAVPLVFGRVQAQLIVFAYIDKGTWIDYLGFWADGHEYGITDIVNVRSVTPGMSLATRAHKFGKKGGSVDDENTQANDDPNWIAAAIYSRTAFERGVVLGTTLQSDDPVATIVGILMGQRLPVPDASGNFSKIDFCDVAVAQSRWLLSSGYYFNLPAAWHDDAENLKAYDYCNHVLVDQQNTDTVLLPANQTPYAGAQYHLYKSTAALAPSYFQSKIDNIARLDNYLLEADYNFYDNPPVNSDDWSGTGTPSLPPTQFRRRFTSNLQLLEQMPALDFLFDTLLPGSNLYLVQKANGKIAHRVKRPEDFCFVRQASAAGASSIEVTNVNPWLAKKGKILIAANTPKSEVRTVTNARYSTAGNAVTLSASGGLTASAGNLSGATDVTPASATLTVTALGLKTYAIAGYNLVYSPQAGDSLATCAAFIAAQINSHEILNKIVKAVWSGNTVVTIESRFGVLDFDVPLEFEHFPQIADPAQAASLTETTGGTLVAGTYQYTYTYVTAEGETNPAPITSVTVANGARLQTPEFVRPSRVLAIRHYFSMEANGVRRRMVAENKGASLFISTTPRDADKMEPIYNATAQESHRIAFSFTDKGTAQTGVSRSNVLKATFKFPLGNRHKNYNQIKIKFRDSAADYKLTELIINDSKKQAKAKKPITLEINGAGIDNEHQARRIGNSLLAEYADGNKFVGFSSDNEALLLEQGDVICVTDASGRYINEPVRIEDVNIDGANGYPTVSFVARKYRRYYYDDQVRERLVPLAIVQNVAVNREQGAPTVYAPNAAQNAAAQIGIRNYSVAPYYREIQVSHYADFSVESDITSFEQNADNQVGKILPEIFVIERESLNNHTALTNTETVYVRVRHSTNGAFFGAWSLPFQVVFPNSGGTGGSGGGVPAQIPPQNLQAAYDQNAQNVIFSWAAGSGTGAHTLEISNDNAIFAPTNAQIGAGQTTASFALARAASDYTRYFRLRRSDVAGYSNTVTVIVPALPAAPDPPIFTAASYDAANQRTIAYFTPRGGTANYTVDRNLGSGWVRLYTNSVLSDASSFIDQDAETAQAAFTKIIGYRIARHDETNFSNEIFVEIPAQINQTPPNINYAYAHPASFGTATVYGNFAQGNDGTGGFTVLYDDPYMGSMQFGAVLGADATSFLFEVPRSFQTKYIDIYMFRDDGGESNRYGVEIPGTSDGGFQVS